MTAPLAITAIILAAGASRRFGADDKLTSPLGGQPMIAHVFDLAATARIDALAVLAPGSKVAGLAGERGIRTVTNPAPERGIGRSLACGIAALEPSVDGCLVLLGDMPWISPRTITALIDAAQAHPQALALKPVHQGQAGNPALIRAPLFSRIKDLDGDDGAKAILAGLGDRLVSVPVEDPAILRDVDRPGDLPPPGAPE